MQRLVVYLVFFMSLGTLQSLYSQSFTRIEAGFPVCQDPAAAWVDVDNDGDLDVFLSGLNEIPSPEASLFLNNGGTFTYKSTSINGVYSAACAFGDFNNDGLADLALSGTNGSTASTTIYRNDGNGTFTNINAGITGLYGGGVAWGDYNNDGWNDLLVCGKNNSQDPITLLYENNTGGSFAESGLSFTGLSQSSLAWCDLDLDLDLDFVIAGMDDVQNPRSIIYINDNATFSEMGAGLTDLKAATVAWGDYNNDTYPDLLMTGSGSDDSPKTLVYKNINGNSFTALPASFFGILNGSAIWGDFNNDGSLDFLIGGEQIIGGGVGPPMPDKPAKIELFINSGNDQFSKLNIQLNGVENNAIVCGDYDGDSDLDLLISGEILAPISVVDENAAIYRNETPVVNTPPNAPDGLTYEFDAGEILFQWNASTDDKTPSEGLNYNLRVGTMEGNMDIMSGLADLDDGYRHIVSRGNTGGSTSCLVTDLEFGEYYVSVQAIDPNYAGSEFSISLSVEITPTATFSMQDSLCVFEEDTINYTGNASSAATYNWNFNEATVVSGSGQGPYVVYWSVPGLKTVSLTVTENAVSSEPYSHEVLVEAEPEAPGTPTGPDEFCQGMLSSNFVILPVAGAETYEWDLQPPEAGVISGNDILAEVVWNLDFSGPAYVRVRAINFCGIGPYSDSLSVIISPLPGQPGQAVGPTALCLNNPNTNYTALAAPYGQGYQWQLLPEAAGVLFSNGLQAEVDWDNSFTGQARICLTSFNDCGVGPSSDTLYISVSYPPTANAGEDQIISFGNSTQLFGSASGGSGSYAYGWTPDSLLINAHIPEPTTLPLELSVQFDLRVTDEQSGCPASDQVIVTVIGGPLYVDVSADPDSICLGEETQLLALAGGGSGAYIFSWSSSPAGFSSDIADPIAVPDETTMYYCELSDGSEIVIDSTLVEVFPQPAAAGEIEGPENVCYGSVQVLYEIEAVADATHYLWTLSDGIYGSSDSTAILVGFSLFAQEESISVAPANGCGLGPASTINITIIDKPDIPFTPVGPDSLCTTTDTIGTYIISEPVPDATAYEWAILPEEAGTIQGDGLTAQVNWVTNWVGEAYISARAMNECGYSEWTEPITVHTFNCLGIEDPFGSNVNIKIYPNPTKGALKIEYSGFEDQHDIKLQLWDIYGRMVMHRELVADQATSTIDLSYLPDGMYIIVIEGKNGLRLSHKIILSK